MKKYRLEIYGWMMNASAHSIVEKDLDSVSNILSDNAENTWELYDYFTDNIRDIHEPDLFRNEKPFWYDDDTKFFLFDANTELHDNESKPIKEWSLKECSSHYHIDEDFDDYTNIVCFPGETPVDEISKKYADPPYDYDIANNIVLHISEGKGGLFYFEFESDDEIKPKDFSVAAGCIESPNGDWDFCDKFFYKGKELEIVDYLDNSGKATHAYIFRKDEL